MNRYNLSHMCILKYCKIIPLVMKYLGCSYSGELKYTCNNNFVMYILAIHENDSNFKNPQQIKLISLNRSYTIR